MKISLIGFMGCGKSTISALLAKEFNHRLIELDQRAIDLSGHRCIQEIFDNEGEERFRELETMALREIASLKKVVISCGGGIVLAQSNIVLLKKNGGKIIYLACSVDTIKKRLSADDSRPLLKGAAIEDIYHKRVPLYEKFADITAITDELSPEQVVLILTEQIQKIINTVK
jgi:shikimate kinase